MSFFKKTFGWISCKLSKTYSEMGTRNRENKKTYFQKVSLNIIITILAFSTIMAFTDLRLFNLISFRSSMVKLINNDIGYQLIYYIIYFLTAGTYAFLMKPQSVRPSLFICVPLTVIGYILRGGFIPGSIYPVVGLFLMGLGGGALLVSSLWFFVFDLNGAERLLSTIFIAIISVVYFLLVEAVGHSFQNSYQLGFYLFLLPFIGLIILYASLFFIKKKHFVLTEEKTEKLPSQSVVLVFFSVTMITFCSFLLNHFMKDGYFLSDGYLSCDCFHFFHYLGYVLCIFIVLTVYSFRKNAIGLLISFYVILIPLTFQNGLLNVVFNNNIIFGLSCTMMGGFCLALDNVILIMLLGKVFGGRPNFRTFRYVIICIVLSGLAGTVVELLLHQVSMEVGFAISLFISGIILAFSFALYAIMHSGAKNHVAVRTGTSEEVVDWESLLTPKEKEVFLLLLDGLTMRQISGELHMKYDAVNYHYKNIYRKLNINSRVELIVRYAKKGA